MGVFGALHLVRHAFTLAVIEWGIAVNCLPVVVIGICMLRDRDEAGKRITSFWNKEARQQHRRENPHMLGDTLALTAATAMPFLAFAVVLCEMIARPQA